MIKIGEAELHKNNYVTINAALKSFEEIIDAYCALSGLHFHEDPSTGWKKRIVWIVEKSLLYEEWEKILELIDLFFKNNNDKYIKEIISIIKKNKNNLEIYYNENKK
jgi:predicted MPP superfamily phosphohydrolase